MEHDGANPHAGVIGDTTGNLYGTTIAGGATDNGTVYKIDASGHETMLHSFMFEKDGDGPYAGVIRDSAGSLYGTTIHGGEFFAGTIYRIDASGQETVLHSFTENDGGSTFAGVIRDAAGNLYGTALAGGTSGGGTREGGASFRGTVYEIDASGDQTVLYSFRVGPMDTLF